MLVEKFELWIGHLDWVEAPVGPDLLLVFVIESQYKRKEGSLAPFGCAHYFASKDVDDSLRNVQSEADSFGVDFLGGVYKAEKFE